jgi:hypothetical protein
MEPHENEPRPSEAPSTTETPSVSGEPHAFDGQPRYFGVMPRGLAAVGAAFAFGAGIVLLVSGDLLIGALLLVAAAVLAAVYAAQAWRRRDSTLDRVTATAVDRSRAFAGFIGSSLRAWTVAGRKLTRLRLQANHLAKERAQLQYALGGAVYVGDEAEAERLRGRMRAADDRIAACAAEAHEVLERMRATRAQERLAVVATEIRRPDDAKPPAEAGVS